MLVTISVLTSFVFYFLYHINGILIKYHSDEIKYML
jgi:hypothetical protein